MSNGPAEHYLQNLLKRIAGEITCNNPALSTEIASAGNGLYPPQCGLCHKHCPDGETTTTGLYACRACISAAGDDAEPCGQPEPYPTADSILEIRHAGLGKPLSPKGTQYGRAAELALQKGMYIAELGRCGWGSIYQLDADDRARLKVEPEIAAVVMWNDGEYWAPPLLPAHSVRLLTREESARVLESATSIAVKRLWQLRYEINGNLRKDRDTPGLIKAAEHLAKVYEQNRLSYRIRRAKQALDG